MSKSAEENARNRQPHKPQNNGAAALQLVSTPEFADIWKQLNDRFVSRSEFNAMPMPAGASADDVWAITRDLLKGAGTTLNHPAWFSKDAEESMWYYTPKFMEDRIRSIQQRTANGSDLGININKFKSIPLCFSLMADELQSVLADDNIPLDRDQLQRVFLHGRPPLSPEERIAANLRQLYIDLDEFKDRPIDRPLIERLYERLAENVGKAFPASSHLDDAIVNWELFTPDYVLDRICRFADGTASPDFIHPVFVGFEIRRFFVDYLPLPMLNACVCHVLRTLYYDKQDCSVMEFIPASAIERSFANADMDIAARTELMAQRYRDSGVDATWFHEVMTEAYDQAISSLEQRMAAFVENRAKQRKAINTMSVLNSRQKDVLLLFLKSPEATVTIAAHRTRHDVTYSTAREDLLALEQLGFVHMRINGRAYEYTVGPRLLQLAAEE